MYSTFGLFSRPLSAVAGTSMAIAFMPKISCLTEPLAAATADLTLAAAPGLKATMMRVLSGGAAVALPNTPAASRAVMQIPSVADARGLLCAMSRLHDGMQGAAGPVYFQDFYTSKQVV